MLLEKVGKLLTPRYKCKTVYNISNDEILIIGGIIGFSNESK